MAIGIMRQVKAAHYASLPIRGIKKTMIRYLRKSLNNAKILIYRPGLLGIFISLLG